MGWVITGRKPAQVPQGRQSWVSQEDIAVHSSRPARASGEFQKLTALTCAVDGIIFADDKLIEQIKNDQGPEQVVNVATLPGIQKASLAMPDIHWGYGFCIGGVAATDPEEGGVISPGGVGYDINCGVRLLGSNLELSDVKDRIRPLIEQLFRDIPTGVGQSGKYQFDKAKLTRLMAEGASYVVNLGFGSDHDLLVTEAGGCLDGADPGRVSDRAITRGFDQCGTLGSGNHFLEVQVVDRVLDPVAAEVMGLREGQITVLIHSGSAASATRFATTTWRPSRTPPNATASSFPTRSLPVPRCAARRGKLTWAPCAAANYAWCNRQLLAHQAREVFAKFFGKTWEQLGMDLVYDVAHNIAKFEDHEVGGGHSKQVCVHRKGATRAFPPAIPISRRFIAQSVSPSSSPAAWGRPVGSWPARPAACSTRSERAAMAPAG